LGSVFLARRRSGRRPGAKHRERWRSRQAGAASRPSKEVLRGGSALRRGRARAPDQGKVGIVGRVVLAGLGRTAAAARREVGIVSIRQALAALGAGTRLLCGHGRTLSALLIPRRSHQDVASGQRLERACGISTGRGLPDQGASGRWLRGMVDTRIPVMRRELHRRNDPRIDPSSTVLGRVRDYGCPQETPLGAMMKDRSSGRIGRSGRI
jgi:hypothetical protein